MQIWRSGSILSFCTVVSAASSAAQSVATTPAARSAQAFDFSIANIMRGPEHYGREPQRVQWSADSRDFAVMR